MAEHTPDNIKAINAPTRSNVKRGVPPIDGATRPHAAVFPGDRSSRESTLPKIWRNRSSLGLMGDDEWNFLRLHEAGVPLVTTYQVIPI